MRTVETSIQLLQAFANLVEEEDLIDLKLRVFAGKNPELRLEAGHSKDHFPLVIDLYPSRKILDRKEESETDRGDLILSPHIPGELAKDFRRNRINHADLNGRLYVKTESLLLDKEPRNNAYRGPAPKADWFSLKSSRILRALLSHPEKQWTQNELIKRSGVSGGLVSRILKGLEADLFLEKRHEAAKGTPALYRLRDGNRLLDRWKSEDDWSKRVHIVQYSLLKDDAITIAKTVQDGLGGENLAFTQWFAANLRYPFTTSQLVSAYVRKERLEGIRFGRKVESGGNLWLFVPEDEGVFKETRDQGEFQLVSDIQIYLDLVNAGMRGPDHAEALRKWVGFNR